MIYLLSPKKLTSVFLIFAIILLSFPNVTLAGGGGSGDFFTSFLVDILFSFLLNLIVPGLGLLYSALTIIDGVVGSFAGDGSGTLGMSIGHQLAYGEPDCGEPGTQAICTSPNPYTGMTSVEFGE